jgi:hypothetical protein
VFTVGAAVAVELSVQQLLENVYADGNHCASGGSLVVGLMYCRSTGLVTEAELPYRDGSITTNSIDTRTVLKKQQVVAKCDDLTQLVQEGTHCVDRVMLLQALCRVPTIGICVTFPSEASLTRFQAYRGPQALSVFCFVDAHDAQDGPATGPHHNHALLLVGYGFFGVTKQA